jgi:hypothetical protein
VEEWTCPQCGEKNTRTAISDHCGNYQCKSNQGGGNSPAAVVNDAGEQPAEEVDAGVGGDVENTEAAESDNAASQGEDAKEE